MSSLTDRPASVWTSTDRKLLSWAIPFYWRGDSPRILDATYGKGFMWGHQLDQLRAAIDLHPKVEGVLRMDNRHLAFKDEVFDVVVYDPPHMPAAQSSKGSSKNFDRIYSTSVFDPVPFCKEAHRVLAPEGILLTKIADMVHNHQAQWQHIALMTALDESGFCACDMIVKTKRNLIQSSKWQNAYHARKAHCFWIIARKGKCEPKERNP